MDYSVYSNPRAQQRQTPQTTPIPGKQQVENNAGGFVFALSKWDHLDRFLILGSENGTYYASEKVLTANNIANVRACIEEDGCRVVDRAIELSQSGRAPKNDAALFVIALVASDKRYQGNRQYAISQFHKAARTGTHLFHFIQFVNAQRGWGRALKRGVANWYTEKSVDDLIYQLIKYKSRDGWSHKDVLSLAHPKAKNAAQIELFKRTLYDEKADPNPELNRFYAAEKATHSKDVKEVCQLIKEFNLPHEVINRDLLSDKKIWEALVWQMPLGAMIRNLGKLTSLGLLEQGTPVERHVVSTLLDAEKIKKARIHPINVLGALKTYSSGQGMRSTWIAKRSIIDALDRAFYSAFANVEPTGKRILMALDISGSMFGNKVNGMASLDAATVSAAMALITCSVENNVILKGFTCEGGGAYSRYGAAYKTSKAFQDLAISPRMPLDAVVHYMSQLPMGGTDCSLPMRWATTNNAKVDTFIVYTDNETYGGQMHVCQALQEYRNKSGINAKLIVAGVTSTQFTIADPNDSGMMDVVGFDSAVPQLMSDFMRD